LGLGTSGVLLPLFLKNSLDAPAPLTAGSEALVKDALHSQSANERIAPKMGSPDGLVRDVLLPRGQQIAPEDITREKGTRDTALWSVRAR